MRGERERERERERETWSDMATNANWCGPHNDDYMITES